MDKKTIENIIKKSEEDIKKIKIELKDVLEEIKVLHNRRWV